MPKLKEKGKCWTQHQHILSFLKICSLDIFETWVHCYLVLVKGGVGGGWGKKKQSFIFERKVVHLVKIIVSVKQLSPLS